MLKKTHIMIGSLAIKLAQFVKISSIIGPHIAFFSGVSVIAPMVGVFGGLNTLVAYSCIRAALGALCFGVNPLLSLLYHSSFIFASAYWLYDTMFVRIAIPLCAMIIFCVHPQGSVAYALLWLIPIAASFYAQRNIFMKALGTTFMAHAFGSVAYLMTGLVPLWSSIIPVALVERIIFALSMVFIYKIVILSKQLRSINYPLVKKA